MRLACCFFIALFIETGCERSSKLHTPPASSTWEQVLKQARGQTVTIAMWDGDPLVNSYMRDYVASELKQQHDITLRAVGGQGNALVNKLMVDLEAGRTTGDFDVMWINGETFYQLREIKALYGPFTERLPNNQYIDWENPFIAVDFQQPVDGYECPWGNVQLALIYDSEAISEPPRTKEALATWIKRHPGRFTFDNSFTGMTFLKSLLIEFAGGPEALKGPFNDEVYETASTQLWDWVRDVQPYLWREGKTFPEGVAQLHQLFSNDEVDFTMSNNDGEVDNKVLQGVLPKTARGYVLESGTIRNSHYLGIPVNAPHKAAALVLCNFLISPEAQLKKASPEVWGDGTVLSTKLLPEEWKAKFEQIPGRERIAPRSELEKKALMEPVSEIMVRLHADFREKIIEHVSE
ncbi:ABC transporter substrate-binding protein [Gimesia panareensis]|uniref:ABC transporter substrate-binding protein n=1 Tax=Gimesia panareensis TaxID=2527978 RepID=UPI001E408817|nr:ABC transporter substrate-binding protein [Gimesia panareensis]